MGLSHFLIHKLVPNHERKTDLEVRTRHAYVAAWVSIIGNAVLALVKFVLGLMLNSISMLADAAHTASDIVTSVVVLVGFRAARKPADSGHPFGHGRAENVATLVIAVLLGVVALEFLVDAVGRIIHPVHVDGSWPAAGVMALFALFKEWMARFAGHIGHEIESDAVHADAWHHRSDAIATMLVVIALVGASFDVHWLDAVFGVVIAGLIGWVAVGMALEASSTLLGKQAPRGMRDEIARLAGTVTGVRGVHEVMVHQYGPHRVVNVHVETAPDLPVVEAHELASRVEERISTGLGCSTMVHVEPAKGEGGGVRRERIDQIMQSMVHEVPELVGFHAVHVYEGPAGGHIDLHVEVHRTLNVAAGHELAHRLSAAIQAREKDFVVNIHVEPCRADCRECGTRL